MWFEAAGASGATRVAAPTFLVSKFLHSNLPSSPFVRHADFPSSPIVACLLPAASGTSVIAVLPVRSRWRMLMLSRLWTPSKMSSRIGKLSSRGMKGILPGAVRSSSASRELKLAAPFTFSTPSLTTTVSSLTTSLETYRSTPGSGTLTLTPMRLNPRTSKGLELVMKGAPKGEKGKPKGVKGVKGLKGLKGL